MITLHNIARTPTLLAAKLYKLEREGRYDEALRDLVEVAEGKAYLPVLDDAERPERAELLLRYGALIGFLGHNSQIADSQEQSKDLLTRALGEFLELGDEEKAAECENYLSLAYWRTGEHNEASVWLENALKRDRPESSETRLYSHLIRSLINTSEKRYYENIKAARNLEDAFFAFGDAFLIGSYSANLGISLKNTGRVSEALERFELARHYHERSRHKDYLGTAENNLAQLYKATGNFERAHAASDRATAIFRKLKDKTREGFSLDTKAQIFLAEKKFSTALRTADKAINILKRGENSSYQAEAIMTRASALLGLGRQADAVLALVDAVEIVRLKAGESAARKLVESFAAELSATLSKRQDTKVVPADGGALHLLLPDSLAHFPAYTAVRIKNTFLDGYGLMKGSLALVVDEKINRGDLVAIEEIRTGSVKCGTYDSEFGLICLDRGDGEPELFDENDVRILGKIVGVGDRGHEPSGEIAVKPLSS